MNIRTTRKAGFLIFSILLAAITVKARPVAEEVADVSPAGYWKTIDDATNEPRAIVQIKDNGGVFSGSIIKTFPKPGDTGICSECSGDKKDKPIVGLEMIWNLKKDGDEYNGGQILDPKNGKTYKAKITVIEGGAKLKVRGFIGFSLLGRTQTWLKTDAP